ncbi:testis-specific serine/threonine-protein kinase 6-like [Haemaphysalis longicornis]
MGSTDDEDPDEAEKSKQSLEAHGYEVGKTLGAGSYSTVKLVVKDGATYACKIISKEKSCEIYRVKFLPRELKILGATKHPHITRVFKIIEEPVKVFIIMEMACGGDLLEKILRVKRLDEKTSHQFFMQLASALGYLHKHDIAHRDLKCENVLLTTVDVVKLTDFSFARYCSGSDRNKQKELSETYCGSTAYAAPEVLQGVRYKPLHADVWGLGVILYVMVTGLLPYEANTVLHQVRLQMNRQVRFPRALKLSSQLKNLIRGMLEPVVSLRGSMARVVRHPWITRYPSPFKEINRKVYAYEASLRRQRLESQSMTPARYLDTLPQSASGAASAPALQDDSAMPSPAGGRSNQEYHATRPASGFQDAEMSESDLREPVRQGANEDIAIKEDEAPRSQKAKA